MNTEPTDRPVKRKIKRCNADECNKRLKLTDMPCRCGIVFCQIHRLQHDHDCVLLRRDNTLEDNTTINMMRCVADKFKDRI